MAFHRKRAIRRIRRNAAFVAVLLALLVVILVAFRLAPRPEIRVPAVQGD